MNLLFKVNSILFLFFFITSFILNIELTFNYKTIFGLFGSSILISLIIVYIYELIYFKRINKDYRFLVIPSLLLIFTPYFMDLNIFSCKEKSSFLKINEVNISSISQEAYISVDKDVALKSGLKEFNSKTGISSSFIVNEKITSLQNIDGELKWVLPLDFINIKKWFSNDYIPGYILVSALDPLAKVELVLDKKIIVSDNSYFLKNINRIAYLKSGLKKCDTHFEIDDEGNPYYISLIMEHKKGFIGYKNDSVILTNAVTGISKEISMDEIHRDYKWIDNLVVRENVKNEIKWNGIFKLGFTDYLLDGSKSTKIVDNKFSIIDINGSLSYFIGMITTQSKYRSLFIDLNNTSLVSGLFVDMKTGNVSKINLKSNIDTKHALKLITDSIGSGDVLKIGDLYPIIVKDKLYYGCSIFSKEGLFDKIVMIESFDNHIIFPGNSYKEVIGKITHITTVINHHSVENIVIDNAIYREIYKQIQDMELKKDNNPK